MTLCPVFCYTVNKRKFIRPIGLGERPAVPHRVITASRLSDGAVVWRDAAGVWHEDIDRATARDDGDAVAAMLADARGDEAAGRVIAPYEVEVDITPGATTPTIVPVRLRERIRARGPTI